MTDSLTTSASIRFGDNGPDSKSAPVTIIASTGGVIDYPGYGAMVFDLASFRPAKARIPLDLNHDEYSSCGYLNRFDVTADGLIVKGAITPFGSTDYYAQLVHQLREGVPYQASVESRDYTLEYIAAGVMTSVNNTDITGPIFIVREWTLDAVAICKWGKDSDTSVSIAASAGAASNRVFLTAKKTGASMNTQSKTLSSVEPAPPVEEAEKVAENKEVEAEAKAPDAPAVDAVDPSKQTVADAPAAPTVIPEKQSDVTASAARDEFKSFVAAFGNDKAAEYFAAGLSLSDATTKYLAAIRAENEGLKAEKNELTKRLTASRPGESKAIDFKDTNSTPAATLLDVLKNRK